MRSWHIERANHVPRSEPRSRLWLAAGVVLGWALWHVEGVVTGDGLFHEARVRKLADLTSLHLRTVDEFKDGGLHPGYAFPLWHELLALVSWFSGVDPGIVVRHESSLLVPLAVAVTWEAGVAVFDSRWAGSSLVVLSLAVFCFGPGHGGSYATLALPGTAARQLLVPAAIALFFWSRPAALAAVFGALALAHPTYALFLLVPLAAFTLLRAREWRTYAPLLGAALVPTALVLLWLRPIVNETVSHDPGPGERLRGLQHYGDQLVVRDEHHFRLAAEVFGRSGAVAVASLLLLPLAGLALRRRWAAFALAGSLAVLLLTEVPWLFVHFSDAVSLSQARRVAGFAPLLSRSSVRSPCLHAAGSSCRAALVAGIVLQRLWPGDFEYGLRHGGPAAATWIALFGGAIALVAGLDPATRPARAPRARCGRGGLLRAAGVRPWPLALEPARAGGSARALAAPRAPPAHRRAEGRRRARARQDELPGHGAGAGLRRRAPGHARRQHEGERPVRPRARGTALGADQRPARRQAVRGHLGDPQRPPLSSPAMKVLLVTMYFPPAGGGGVQRPLKFATHLPELGIETHVLAPDDPKWIHRDEDLPPPTLAWVHRARYLGPKGRKPAEELHGTKGLERFGVQARLAGRRLLVPDENVSWNLTAIPAAIRIARREGIDAVITTSPPSSVHLVGAAVKRATGVPWVADLRDSVVAHPHRHAERLLVRAKEQGEHAVAGLVTRQANAIVAVSEAIAEEMRERNPKGEVVTIANGSDFDDFAGIEHTPSETFRITHAGSFFGKRDPRPFLTALQQSGLEDVVARFLGDFRSTDREWAEAQGLGERLELIPYAPRRTLARAAARLRDPAAPDPGGRWPRQGRAQRQGLRVPRRRAADPRTRAARRRGGGADPRVGRRRGRRTRGRGRDRERAARPARTLARRVAAGERALRRVEGEGLSPLARRRPRAAAGAHRVRRATSFLFLASVFCVTFEKVHWNVAGTVSLADVLAILLPDRVRHLDATLARPAHERDPARVLRVLPARLSRRLLQPVGLRRVRAVGEGADEVGDPLRVPCRRRRLAVTPGAGVLLAHARLVQRRDRRQRDLRRAPVARRTAGRQPRRVGPLADHRRRQPDQRLRRDQRRERLPAERDDRATRTISGSC